MAEIQLGMIERRFAQRIWEMEPVRTSELVRMAQEVFGWKRTTTNTVIKRLCDKGLFRNDHAVIRACMSREEFDSRKTEAYVEEAFQGSLPAFIAAFTRSRRLSAEEAEEIRRMIDAAQEDTQ